MTVNLYQIAEDPRVVPKTLPEAAVLTGSIRDDQVDVMHPAILMSGAPSDTYNYAYLPDFGRYYFVDPPITERTGLIRLQMHIDVLQTYYDQIIVAPVIVERSADRYNMDIADPDRKFYQDRSNQYLTIGDVGAPANIVMVTVG